MTSDPLILGFDTSQAYCGVALMRGDVCLAAQHEEMKKGQAERLMPLIQEVLAEAGADLSDLSAMGVGIGPGNFTGSRISVSAARGLALALGIPAVGVSLHEALAEGHEGPSLTLIDAKRDSVYAQRFGEGCARGPARVEIADLSNWVAPGLHCLGHNCHEIADTLGLTAGPAAFAPASAVARVAAQKWQTTNLPRPAPLYLRAADAAPSKETGPVILT